MYQGDKNMRNYRDELLKELSEAGSSEKESKELLEIAFKMSDLSTIRRSYQFKKSFIEKLQSCHSGLPAVRQGLSRMRTFLDSGCALLTKMTFPKIFAVSFAVILFFVTFTTVVNAQKSLPGDPLYPVKRLSENVIVAVNPKFKNEVLIRRSEEIKELTEKNKGQNLIKKTIDEYRNNLQKDGKLNPTKVKESKKNLEDAKENSIEENKEEIEKALNQLENNEENENKIENKEFKKTDKEDRKEKNKNKKKRVFDNNSG